MTKDGTSDDRAARLAAALRANLRRRKAQGQERAAEGAAPPVDQCDRNDPAA